MSIVIRYSDDKGRGLADVQGSDGRLNVSSRSDARAYYNSRDEAAVFALDYSVTLMDTDEDFVAWRNASPTKTLVITSASAAVFEPVDIKWHVGSGVPAAGTAIVPANLNQAVSSAAPTDASASFMMGTGSTPITGLTSGGVVGLQVLTITSTSFVIEWPDTIRLGQGDTFFGEMELASTPGFVRGIIYGYYE